MIDSITRLDLSLLVCNGLSVRARKLDPKLCIKRRQAKLASDIQDEINISCYTEYKAFGPSLNCNKTSGRHSPDIWLYRGIVPIAIYNIILATLLFNFLPKNMNVTSCLSNINQILISFLLLNSYIHFFISMSPHFEKRRIKL